MMMSLAILAAGFAVFSTALLAYGAPATIALPETVIRSGAGEVGPWVPPFQPVSFEFLALLHDAAHCDEWVIAARTPELIPDRVPINAVTAGLTGALAE